MTVVEAARLASFGMVVLIWLVQLIIYPSFVDVLPERFVAWHDRYTRVVQWLVGPLMLGQTISLGWLLATRPTALNVLACISALIAVCVTGAISVPMHQQLHANGADPLTIARLIRSNWIRTIGWTLSFVFLLV